MIQSFQFIFQNTKTFSWPFSSGTEIEPRALMCRVDTLSLSYMHLALLGGFSGLNHAQYQCIHSTDSKGK